MFSRSSFLLLIAVALVASGCVKRNHSRVLDTRNLGGNTDVVVGYIATLPEVQDVIGRYNGYEITGSSLMESGMPIMRDIRGTGRRKSSEMIRIKGSRTDAIMLLDMESKDKEPSQVTSVKVFSRAAWDSWFVLLPPPHDADILHAAALDEVEHNSAVRSHVGEIQKVTWLEYPLGPAQVLDDLNNLAPGTASQAPPKIPGTDRGIMVCRPTDEQVKERRIREILTVVSDPLPNPEKAGRALLESVVTGKHANERSVNLRIDGTSGSCLFYGVAKRIDDHWIIHTRHTMKLPENEPQTEVPDAAKPKAEVIYDAT